MKLLAWEIRFTMRMRMRSGLSLRYCWDYALAELENIEDGWKEFNGAECADEAMSVWSD